MALLPELEPKDEDEDEEEEEEKEEDAEIANTQWFLIIQLL